MAAPQTGLTNCLIGDMGHPRTVHGNPRYIPSTWSFVVVLPPNHDSSHMQTYTCMYDKCVQLAEL